MTSTPENETENTGVAERIAAKAVPGATETLADRFKLARLSVDLNVQEMADALGITRGGIYRIESGKSKDVRETTMRKFEDVTGFTGQWLITGKGPRYTAGDGNESALLRKLLFKMNPVQVRNTFVDSLDDMPMKDIKSLVCLLIDELLETADSPPE